MLLNNKLPVGAQGVALRGRAARPCLPQRAPRGGLVVRNAIAEPPTTKSIQQGVKDPAHTAENIVGALKV